MNQKITSTKSIVGNTPALCIRSIPAPHITPPQISGSAPTSAGVTTARVEASTPPVSNPSQPGKITVRLPTPEPVEVARAPECPAPKIKAPVIQGPIIKPPVIKPPVIERPVIKPPVIRPPDIKPPDIKPPSSGKPKAGTAGTTKS